MEKILMHNINQQYMYALFNDGHRMTGTKYGQTFTSREEARSMRRNASNSKSIKGSVVIGRAANQWDWVS